MEQQQPQQVRRNRNGVVQVLDGSEIQALVENEEAFAKFVDDRFRKLDADGDGRLSVKELQPAVADIGAAIGLPARGSSRQADHIYAEVLNEFTHGKQDSVSKSDFQRVLSDILLGMAAGLKRDPIVILRINGEDLNEFVDSPRYEPEAVAIFSQVDSGNNTSLRQFLLAALRQLTVDHGMPPASDSWVVENIVEPAMQELSSDQVDQPVSQEGFFQEFKKFLGIITRRLQQHPVIVAHTENTFDGSGIRRLLSSKFEFDKNEHGNAAIHLVYTTRTGSLKSSDFEVIDVYRFPNIRQVDAVVNEAFKMAKADDGKAVDEAEFKKLLAEILGAIMLQLNGNPISVSTNAVVHEPMSSSSSLLSPTPLSPMVSSPSE
ncbi:hypothetical protein BAE44_0018155 [Dichanthelium oligosanthes]|uniref:EF-hand domain-containing protein n=1 Tax=Dichanthelium oligosanthes TaxID=888268 RepID=A0A1E5V6P0_9POAL|nr:hypothetical protein BAE44_0018155 [Dichanthelium oligosanthes]